MSSFLQVGPSTMDPSAFNVTVFDELTKHKYQFPEAMIDEEFSKTKNAEVIKETLKTPLNITVEEI
jgi:hypothetical protein